MAAKPEGDAGAAVIRAATQDLRRPRDACARARHLRDAVDPFEPQNDTVMALTRGIKTSFDPARILNPGRMYAGI